MTAADKAGIGIAVGITVAFVAFAIMSSGMSGMQQTRTTIQPSVPAMPVTPQVPTPQPPAPIPAPVEETQPVEPETPSEEATSDSTSSDETSTEEMPSTSDESSVPSEQTQTEEHDHSDMMSADVSIKQGASMQGCETENNCYDPSEITANSGTTITWTNNDDAPHTVSSGSPSDGLDGAFDSSIINPGESFEATFDEVGEYDYFCQIHPWLTGKVIVE
jgi:plastocyanin